MMVLSGNAKLAALVWVALCSPIAAFIIGQKLSHKSFRASWCLYASVIYSWVLLLFAVRQLSATFPAQRRESGIRRDCEQIVNAPLNCIALLGIPVAFGILVTAVTRKTKLDSCLPSDTLVIGVENGVKRPTTFFGGHGCTRNKRGEAISRFVLSFFILAIVTTVIVGIEVARMRTHFDSYLWKDHPESNRWRMANDIVESHLLLGQERARVIEMLGLPDDEELIYRSRNARSPMTISLLRGARFAGIEVGGVSMDDTSLAVSSTPRGLVTRRMLEGKSHDQIVDLVGEPDIKDVLRYADTKFKMPLFVELEERKVVIIRF